jgi:hypothetical protein
VEPGVGALVLQPVVHPILQGNQARLVQPAERSLGDPGGDLTAGQGSPVEDHGDGVGVRRRAGRDSASADLGREVGEGGPCLDPGGGAERGDVLARGRREGVGQHDPPLLSHQDVGRGEVAVAGEETAEIAHRLDELLAHAKQLLHRVAAGEATLQVERLARHEDRRDTRGGRDPTVDGQEEREPVVLQQTRLLKQDLPAHSRQLCCVGRELFLTQRDLERPLRAVLFPNRVGLAPEAAAEDLTDLEGASLIVPDNVAGLHEVTTSMQGLVRGGLIRQNCRKGGRGRLSER